ncbi:MAG: hypothetical protein SWX82_02800 [Cyanobacteriota bacterium]|nr:hypothetical protein [Cyanobacteriota bacterium]
MGINSTTSWEQDAPTVFVLDQNNYNAPPPEVLHKYSILFEKWYYRKL